MCNTKLINLWACPSSNDNFVPSIFANCHGFREICSHKKNHLYGIISRYLNIKSIYYSAVHIIQIHLIQIFAYFELNPGSHNRNNTKNSNGIDPLIRNLRQNKLPTHPCD